MKYNKYLFVIFVLLLCSFSQKSYSYIYTWNYAERQVWGDGTMPDGDIYGNGNVWYYQYKTAAYTYDSTFIASTYQYMPYWSDYGYRLSTNTSSADYWCVVQTNGIFGSINHDAIIQFVVPISGQYNVYINVENINPNQSNGQKIYLLHNDTLLDEALNPDDGTQEFNETLWLNSGESIYFIVNSLGETYFDNLIFNDFTLTTTVTTVAEPLSVFLLGISCTGIIKRKNRRCC